MLNRWYLLVGYIHESTYISTIDLGKIYDGVTGEAVVSMRDHKFKASATQLQHRTIIYGSSDTSDRQYMYAPRMELVDGTEWTLNQLLSINPDSKLLFAYDNAGNQKQRFYCAVADCSVPNPPAGRVAPEDVVASKETETEAIEEVKLEEDSSILKKDFTLYPNPTNGKVTIQLSGKDYNLTKSISIYSTNGSLVQKININNPTSQMELDISDKPTGVYFIHMHFSNGTVTTEQIIKE